MKIKNSQTYYSHSILFEQHVGMAYWVLNGDTVSLLGVNDTRWTMKQNWFFAGVNIFTLLGDAVSRKAIYRLPRLYHPYLWLLCNLLAACCVCSAIPLLFPVAMFLLYWGNGAVYATSTKHIDESLGRRFNLIALSFWRFIGDVG